MLSSHSVMYTAEFTTESPILSHALRAAPSMRIEHVDDRMVRDGPIKLIVRAHGGDFAAFERGLDTDPTVADIKMLTAEETHRLYRINYSPQGECESFTTVVTDLDATFVDAVVTARELWMKICFPDHKAVKQFADWFRQHERTFSLDSLYEESELINKPRFELTESQREALALAQACGYFCVPRETTGAELAAELEISPQAFSERVRRGTSTVLKKSSIPVNRKLP